jgi:hypothetical protein
MVAKAAMTFALCIKRGHLGSFDDGVMVGPSLFETVREQFDGRGTPAVPYQKASCRCAKTAHHPKNILHCVAPYLCSVLIPVFSGLCYFPVFGYYDAPGGLDAAKF